MKSSLNIMLINRGSKVPLFQQITDTLIAQIDQGLFAAGDLLPSEMDLIQRFAVSRTTVRLAIKELVSQGRAYTIHGKGTYVADTLITQFLPSLTSFSHDAAARGMQPARKVLTYEVTPAGNKVAAKLLLSPGSPVIHVDRLLLADGEPVSIGYTYLPLAVVSLYQDELTAHNLESKGLYESLRELDILLKGGEHIISAVSATADQARLLAVEPGAALISGERVAFTIDNVPIEYTEIVSRPDKQRWRIILGPPDDK